MYVISDEKNEGTGRKMATKAEKEKNYVYRTLGFRPKWMETPKLSSIPPPLFIPHHLINYNLWTRRIFS